MKNIKSLVMVGLLSASMLVSVGCQSTNDNGLTTTNKEIVECFEMEDVVILDNETTRITVTDKIVTDDGSDYYGYAIRVENKLNEPLIVMIKENNKGACFSCNVSKDELFVDELMMFPLAQNIEDINGIEGILEVNFSYEVNFKIN